MHIFTSFCVTVVHTECHCNNGNQVAHPDSATVGVVDSITDVVHLLSIRQTTVGMKPCGHKFYSLYCLPISIHTIVTYNVIITNNRWLSTLGLDLLLLSVSDIEV